MALELRKGECRSMPILTDPEPSHHFPPTQHNQELPIYQLKKLAALHASAIKYSLLTESTTLSLRDSGSGACWDFLCHV